MKALIPALLALAAASAPAYAETISRPVGYGDLDLASKDGQSALASRLRNAIRSVCVREDVEDLRTAKQHRKCRREASERATNDAELAIAGYDARASRRLASGR